MNNISLKIVLCGLLTMKFESVFSEKNAFSYISQGFKNKIKNLKLLSVANTTSAWSLLNHCIPHNPSSTMVGPLNWPNGSHPRTSALPVLLLPNQTVTWLAASCHSPQRGLPCPPNLTQAPPSTPVSVKSLFYILSSIHRAHPAGSL